MRFIAAILLFFTFTCKAQHSDLDLLVQKIKIDYPGYTEKTRNIDFDKFVAQTIALNKTDTFKAMATIVSFFKDRHLDLFRILDSVDKDILDCDSNLKSIQKYLNSSIPKKQYEGYWLSEFNHLVIAIKEIQHRPLKYKAFIIKSLDSTKTPPGMVVYDFDQTRNNIYYTKATSTGMGTKFYVWSEFRNDSVFTAGPYSKWRKLNGYNQQLLNKLPIRPLNNEASGKWLSDSCYFISIPASTQENGTIIDCLIRADANITRKAETLIIDLRNNTGGTTMAYEPLLPLLYTNPILMPNVDLYCTKDGAVQTKEHIASYIKTPTIDSTYLNGLKEIVALEEDSTGLFVAFPQDTLKFDKVLPYPKQVGIIINYGCQSAAELFLLNALQSKKVKLFGEHTQGVVDYLDFYPIELSEKYQLYVPKSRRVIPKGGKKLDGKGIHPNVYIGDNEKDWVKFVENYYAKKP